MNYSQSQTHSRLQLCDRGQNPKVQGFYMIVISEVLIFSTHVVLKGSNLLGLLLSFFSKSSREVSNYY
jgi:hypothetical protein